MTTIERKQLSDSHVALYADLHEPSGGMSISVATVQALADEVRAARAIAPRVLEGDPKDIQAALDALPLESVITYGSGIDFTAAIHVRAVSFVGTVWYETAFSKPTDSEAISRNGTITVIA